MVATATAAATIAVIATSITTIAATAANRTWARNCSESGSVDRGRGCRRDSNQ